jgi:NADH dehydrogenase
MKIAITGGTGFVGKHLAESLCEKKHKVVLIARGYDNRNPEVRQLQRAEFVAIGTADESRLIEAFEKCDAVAHCAGINREVEDQTYDFVHVQGTRNVVNAAKKAGVKKVVLMSFYAARPDCGSAYHESKYAAEELVRESGLDYTVIKAGMVYGKGDHMLDHLSHIFYTLPFFALVGFQRQHASPLAIEDLIRILEAALLESRLSQKTVAVLGPDKLTFEECVKRVAKVVGKQPIVFAMPLAFHYAFANLLERTMKIPLISKAQVQMLAEGFEQKSAQFDELPGDLVPQTIFDAEQIRKHLPEPGPFKIEDLKCWQG